MINTTTGGDRAPGEDEPASLLLARAEAIAHVGSWMVDFDAGVAAWSDELYRILGLERDAQPLSAATMRGLIHPDDLERFDEGLRLAVERGALPAIDVRVIRADGGIRWLRMQGELEAGSPAGRARFTGFAQDITERKLAEATLAGGWKGIVTALDATIESVAIFRTLLDDDGHLVDLEILFANQQARARWAAGQPLEAVIGQPLFERFPALRPVIWDLYAEVVEDGHPYLGKYSFAMGGGSRTFDLAITPFDGGVIHVARDVTEQERTIEALRISEERYRRTIEGVDAIVFFQPYLGGPAYVSPQVRTILGYEPDEVVHIGAWNKHIHPDDLEHCIDAWLGPEPSWKIEFRMQRADGTWIWVSDQGSRLPRTDGLGDGSFGYVTDITAHHDAEARLRQSEEQFRAVVEENPESITLVRPVMNANGEFVDALIIGANRISRQRHFGGAALEDIEGKHALQVAPALRDPIFAHIAEVATTGVPFRGETSWHYGEATAWSDVTIFPFEAGLAIMGRDVTARKVAEEALRASEARYRAVADSAADAIVTVDADQRIVGWNPSAERMFGVQAAAAIGRPLGILQASEDAEAHRARLAAVLTDPGRHLRGELTELVAHRADGTAFPVQLSLSDWELEGTRFVTAIIRDISDQRALESQLRQAQRLEAIGQLAGGVAHDFNNLLAAITGYGEFVQAALPEGSDVRRDMDEVLRAADRAAELTRQLLAFSRRQAVDRVVLDPADVVAGIVPMLRRLLGEHIAVEVRRSANPVRVLADRVQLEQVLMNLAVNARDAMPSGGRLSVATGSAVLTADEVVGFDGLRPGSVARITVTDTGSGMDDDTLARIYDPFFTTKEVGKGTGLGLATVYGIVVTIGGRIAATSELGRGTTFTIDLPPADEPSADLAATAAPARRPSINATVLLVEDDSSVRTVLARHLEAVGCTVVGADSGEAALERFAGLDLVDVVISDIRMPGIQGPELVRLLRAQEPGIAIVMMSGYADEAVLADPALAGITILEKPFDAAHLVEVVRGVIAGKA